MKKKLIIILLLITISISLVHYKYSNNNHLPVLGYHSVVLDEDKETKYRDDPYTISKSTFIKHLDYLKENNFNTVTMNQVIDYYYNQISLPTNPVLLTFDDGHIDLATIIDPLLNQYNFTASAFIIASKLENNTSTKYDYITLEQMALTTNLEYYSHTYDMHKTDGNKKLLETATVAEIIEDHNLVNQYVDNSIVAYPYGISSNNAIQAYKESNVLLAFNYNNFTHLKPTSNPYDLPRYMITDLTPLWYIKWIIE